MSTVDRKANIYLHSCIGCEKEELLKYPTYWHRVNRGLGKCKSCAPKNMDGLVKGQGWNKGMNISGMACHYYVTFKRKMPEGIIWGHNFSRRIAS